MRIQKLRENIEKIDTAIIKKLSQRQKLILQIGKLKLKSGKPIKDLKREKKLFELYDRLSHQYQLYPPFTRQLFNTIIMYCRRLQKHKK